MSRREKKHVALYNKLKNQILGGELKNGDKLPSEAELNEESSMSRQTVRQALEALEKEGLIRKVRGSGSYVQYQTEHPKTRRIAVITYNIATSVFPVVLSEIESVLFEHGYSTELYSTMGKVEKERNILMQLLDRPVDGIIMHATQSALSCVNKDILLKLRERGVKMLFMDCYYLDPEFVDVPRITMEDYNGAHSLVTQLIGEGHKMFGGVFCYGNCHLVNRFNGVRKAIVENGLHYTDELFLVVEGEKSLRAQLDVEISKQIAASSAVICATGILAASFLECLQKCGLGNVRTFITFDEVQLPSVPGLEVLMLRHSSVEMGRLCAKNIIRLIEGMTADSVELPWTLVRQ